MKTEIILPLTIAGGFIVLYLLQEEEVPEIKKSPEIKKLDKEIEKLDEEISLALENEKQILTEKEKNAQAIIQLKKAEIEKANEEFEKAKKKVTAEYKQRLERARELRDIREKEERAAREKELNEEFRETFKRKELEKEELEKRNQNINEQFRQAFNKKQEMENKEKMLRKEEAEKENKELFITTPDELERQKKLLEEISNIKKVKEGDFIRPITGRRKKPSELDKNK